MSTLIAPKLRPTTWELPTRARALLVQRGIISCMLEHGQCTIDEVVLYLNLHSVASYNNHNNAEVTTPLQLLRKKGVLEISDKKFKPYRSKKIKYRYYLSKNWQEKFNYNDEELNYYEQPKYTL